MGLGRLELPTSRLSGVRSNHLSYRPLKVQPKLDKGAGPFKPLGSRETPLTRAVPPTRP